MPFSRAEDGAAVHVCRERSDPGRHRVISRNDVWFRGILPPWVLVAFEREELFRTYVERGDDELVFVGDAWPTMLRSKRGSDEREMILHVRDEMEWMPPDDVPEPAGAHLFIELVRSGGEWIAMVPGTDIRAAHADALHALCLVEDPACNTAIDRLRGGAPLVQPEPDVGAMKAISITSSWPTDDLARASRAVVQIHVSSADLRTPGWAMSRETCWC